MLYYLSAADAETNHGESKSFSSQAAFDYFMKKLNMIERMRIVKKLLTREISYGTLVIPTKQMMFVGMN